MSESARPGSRRDVLTRIRDARGPVARAAEEEYGQIQRAYRQTATLGREACVELFVERLEHYQVGVYKCEHVRLQEAIATTTAARGKSALVVPRDLPREWLPTSVDAVVDAELSYAALDGSDGVLTACAVAIASTGTIVLCHGPGEGRRVLTLVPDYHLCVVFEDQIVETVPEAFRRIGERRPSLVTTISGPSATADIEMTRIRGVHGPRTLDVVVVIGEGEAIGDR
jgi:L-lactate dehydrogenase complex protein LldG